MTASQLATPLLCCMALTRAPCRAPGDSAALSCFRGGVWLGWAAAGTRAGCESSEKQNVKRRSQSLEREVKLFVLLGVGRHVWKTVLHTLPHPQQAKICPPAISLAALCSEVVPVVGQ